MLRLYGNGGFTYGQGFTSLLDIEDRIDYTSIVRELLSSY